MNWYYAVDGQQKGPVEESEFILLRKAGVIEGTTLVWRSGMARWQSCGEVIPLLRAEEPASDVSCSECGRRFAVEDVVRVNRKHVCAECKPIALQKLREGATDPFSELIRKGHISHESAVKSVGFLYLLGGTLVVLAGIGFLAGFLAGLGAQRSVPSGIAAGFFVILGVGQLWTGLGVHRLQPWSRVCGGILSGLGLVVFPVGTLINSYILYVLFSKKGRMVFSPEYHRIIRETPHIKYRTSVAFWVLLGALLLFGITLVAPFFFPR